MYAGMGLNPFIIADEGFWYEPDLTRVKAYDAITTYNAYDWPRTGDKGWAATSGFLPGVEGLFTKWRAATQAAGTAFVPNAMPGYNDRGVRLEEDHFVIPRRLSPQGVYHQPLRAVGGPGEAIRGPGAPHGDHHHLQRVA